MSTLGPAFRNKTQPVRSLLLTSAFYPLMLMWLIIGLFTAPLLFVAIKLATGREVARVIRLMIWIHGRGVIGILSPFVSLRRDDVHSIDRPCILTVNHLSFFDGYYMSALPFHNITFAVGSWPFKMFWYTLFMRLARYMEVESMEWASAVAVSREAFAQGGAVLFFPEGHRSRTGKLQQFHSGAFRLSIETGVPIVPLCITGTDRLLSPGRSRLHPAQVRLQALPAVYPADFSGPSGHIRMRRHVRAMIAASLKEVQ